jgi:hypothetical protein
MLYTAIKISQYTGVYRILSTKVFLKEIGFGFAYDIFFTLGLLFLQALNNVSLSR